MTQKRLLLFAMPVVLSVGHLQAQLRVDSVGATHAKSLGVYQDLGSTANVSPVGIFSQIDGIPAVSKCAISGRILGFDYAHISKTSIGVQGYANECYGYNYGVIGSVPYSSPMTLGAGVYGTTNYSLTPTNGLYAGFFDGDVHVTGNLSTTGTLSGSLLSGALPQSSSRAGAAATEVLGEDVSSQLAHVQVGTYYQTPPLNKTSQPVIDLRTHQQASEEVVMEQAQRKVEQTKLAASRKHFGLNADDIEAVFPDLVYENEDGTKSINYVEMVPLLVQAIGELKAEIAELKGETAKKAKAQATPLSDTTEEVTLLSLGQNKPNPFGETTSIAVSVPEDVQAAFLYVYNLNGSKVAQVDIPARGATSVTLSAATLSEGMYLYSLVADGKIVQTRRMIVEK